MTRTYNIRSLAMRGFTLVEVMIAISIFTVVMVMLASVLIYANRSQLSLTTQQRSLHYGQKVIEHINREIRLSSTSDLPTIYDEDGNVAGGGGGVEVRFRRPSDDDTMYRSYRLVSQTDDDMRTPWDNVLIYDPDSNVSGDEVVLSTVVSTLPGVKPFQYDDSYNAPLEIRMRIGDPAPDPDNPDAETEAMANFRTGPGVQGFEINITVAPRNDE